MVLLDALRDREGELLLDLLQVDTALVDALHVDGPFFERPGAFECRDGTVGARKFIGGHCAVSYRPGRLPPKGTT
jgi:hypothetical protein